MAVGAVNKGGGRLVFRGHPEMGGFSFGLSRGPPPPPAEKKFKKQILHHARNPGMISIPL